MRKIRLLIGRGGTSGPKTAPMALGWKAKSTGNSNQDGKQGTSTRKDLHVLCYEHHTEISRVPERAYRDVLYACGSPVVSFTNYSSQGYFIEPQMGQERAGNQLASIVRRMGALCTSRSATRKKELPPMEMPGM